MKRASFLLVIPIVVIVSGRAENSDPEILQRLTTEAYGLYLSDPDAAISLTERALNISLEKQNLFYEGYCYYLLTKAYWVKANYKLSTEYGFKALKLFNDSPHYAALSETQLALARDLVELGNIRTARKLIGAALRSGIEHGDERTQAAAYREKSYILTELDELDSALECADKGLQLFEKLGDSLEISVLYGRKSRIYFQQERFSQSRDYAYQGLAIDSLVGNRRGLGISYYQAGQNEFALGYRDKAIRQLKKSVAINSDIGNLTWMIKAHELLSSVFLQTGEPALAASELQMVSRLKDELYNSEKSGQIQEMQALHELEGKENTIRLLAQENALKQQQMKNQRLFVAFLLVAVLFLVLLTFVLTRLRSIQHRTNRILANENVAIEQQKAAIQIQAENLRQLDHVKTKLFSVISHDLRGPISNLQSLLDLFTKKLMTAEEFIGLSGKLKENLNVTQRTLENLLNWSLSQMDGIKTERKKIEVTDCIHEVCRLMEEVAARKNISLHKEMDAPTNVWADQNQLQVILRNLIHNAIKFSSYNDAIEIRTSRDDVYCYVTVKDSGIGMSRQEIDAIMDATQYFSKIGTEQEKGTGLGLLLCKEFITRNGGDIDIKSSLGEGTEVSFRLLLAEHRSSPQLALS